MQLVIANTKLELAVLNFKTERRASALPSASVHHTAVKRKERIRSFVESKLAILMMIIFIRVVDSSMLHLIVVQHCVAMQNRCGQKSGHSSTISGCPAMQPLASHNAAKHRLLQTSSLSIDVFRVACKDKLTKM